MDATKRILALGGWLLAAVLGLLLLRRDPVPPAPAPAPSGTPAEASARGEDRVATLEARLATKDRELQELRRRPAASTPAPREAGLDLQKFLLEIDPAGRIRVDPVEVRKLGLDEAQIAELTASTQAYWEQFAAEERRNLVKRRSDATEVSFEIQAFPAKGEALREGLYSAWRRHLDPAAFEKVRGLLAVPFGGHELGFGVCRIDMKVRRDPEGPVSVVERRHLPSGEEVFKSYRNDFDPDPAKGPADFLPQHGHLLR